MHRTDICRYVAIFALGTLGACASGPDPKPEIASARSLISQAEQTGAPEFAGADIQSARDHLQSAEEADRKHRDDEAQRYAAQASIDAKLAIGRTNAAKAERAAEEAQRGVAALKREANRSQQAPMPSQAPTTPAPASTMPGPTSTTPTPPASTSPPSTTPEPASTDVP
jgi:hypothetical protein